MAIKSGDDVILIDGGGPKLVSKRGLTIDLYLNGELTPGTKIIKHRGGKKFDVRFHQLVSYLFSYSLRELNLISVLSVDE